MFNETQEAMALLKFQMQNIFIAEFMVLMIHSKAAAQSVAHEAEVDE